MEGTLTQMIKDYSNDTNKNNGKINLNYYYRNKSNYNSPMKNNNKEIENKKNEIYSSYNQNDNSSYLTPQRKKRYYTEKTEKILNDIEEVKRSLKNKIQYNMNYYNVPNQFQYNINEEEKNYKDNNKNKFNENYDFEPNNNLNNYSYSLEKKYIIEEPKKNYFPKKCPNQKKKYIENDFQIRNNYPKVNYGNNNFQNDYEFINYMNLMIGLKNRKLNQWRREFKEDNFKY